MEEKIKKALEEKIEKALQTDDISKAATLIDAYRQYSMAKEVEANRRKAG